MTDEGHSPIHRVGGMVSLEVLRWPRGFSISEQTLLLGRAPQTLRNISARDASVLVHHLGGLELGGTELQFKITRADTGAELSEHERLPAVPRNKRQRPSVRGQRMWLPYVEEHARSFVTPRAIADAQARAVEATIVIDACAGLGANAIAFALQGKEVFAIEQDAARLALAKENAKHFGVDSKIRFIAGDAIEAIPALRIKRPNSAIFVDPPWAALGATHTCAYHDSPVLSGLESIVATARESMLKLPKTFDLSSLPAKRNWRILWHFYDATEPVGVVRFMSAHTGPHLR